MKKTNACAALCAAFLATIPAAAQMGAQGYKIGVFDSARVLMESKVGQRAQQDLNAFKNDRQKEITARESALEQATNDYVSKSLSYSEERKAEAKEKLDDQKREFQRFYQDNERDLAKEIDRTQKTLQRQLTEVIEEYGAKNGFTLIFERLQCVFNAGTVDITDNIIKAFDAKYASQ